jgi:predicted ATP-grasp superfamily ATP-dependent carboligase
MQGSGQSQDRAVILGMGTNGLALARSLGRQGVGVHGVYVHNDEVGRQSRYCNAVRFPSLRDGEEAFIRKLTDELGDSENKPVLFSESDLYIMFMSHNRERLQKYFRFLLPDQELLETLVRKERTSLFVAGKGFSIPETYFWGAGANMHELLAGTEYPCLMKPIDSFSTAFVKKNARFPDRRSLELFLKERPELFGHVIIQNIIPGGDSNTYQATTYVSKAGDITPIFTMRKTRQCPPDFGVTSYGISEDVPYLREKVYGLLTAMQYRGFISLEFKLHPRTGEWLYIETNPRLPYYHALMYDSGINYPYIYYRDMTDSPVASFSLRNQRNGVIWIYLGKDLESFAKKVMQGQIKTIPWLVSVLKARSFALLDFSDLRPFLYSGVHFVRLVSGKIIKKLTAGFAHFLSGKEKPAGPCGRIPESFRDDKP